MRAICCFILLLTVVATESVFAGATRDTRLYKKIKADLDSVPAIDTHEHLRPFDQLGGFRETTQGKGMNLHGIWGESYFPWCNELTPWTAGMSFNAWWADARDDFDNARATSFYRYLLPAFEDLYGVDFDHISDREAKALDNQIFGHYRSPEWLMDVIRKKSNIEVILNDPNWDRLGHTPAYPFEAFAFNVTTVVRAFHPEAVKSAAENPYVWAAEHGLAVNTLEAYVELLDKLCAARKADGAVALKTTLAYERSLAFENVTAEQAAKIFGKTPDAVSREEQRVFENYIMWRLCELSAKHDLPFQIHTGQARIEGSNPMLLVELISKNKETKFILFHGGYPWVNETAVILQRHGRHVWVDSCWLPTLSYSTAKRAYHEWLDAFPSNRILWGGDSSTAEAIYGATELTRRCLAEVLAEKVAGGTLTREQAAHIGRQILRENALELMPRLRESLPH